MNIITGLTPEQLFAGSLDPEAVPDAPGGVPELSSGSAPVMEEPPDTNLSLPRGLLYEGTWYTEVVTRELTGVDEETLGRFTNFLDRWEVLIALGIESIGPVSFSDKPLAERRSLSMRLLSGERMLVFLAVVGATYGDKRTFEFACQECHAGMETDLLLSHDFPPKVPENGYGHHVYTYVTKNGDKLEFRLPTGADERAVLDRKGLNDAERNTHLLAGIVQKVNGQLPLDPEGYIRNLTIKDRLGLINTINSYQPTVDFSLNITCIKCGHENNFEIQPMELFRF